MSFVEMKYRKGSGRFQFFRRKRYFIPAIMLLITLLIVVPISVVFGRKASTTTQGQPVPTNVTAAPRPSLWVPTQNSSWQIVLSNSITASSAGAPLDVSVYDLDMYTNPISTFQALQSKGKKVICYFSAGTYEPGRPDSNQFLASDKGRTLSGWPDEKWLNINSPNVRAIMSNRVKYAASKGCDAIDPDNVDGFANKNGLSLTAQNSVDFVTFLATEAKRYNMSIGLKNALSIIPQLINSVDFAVNEQCVQYNECNNYAPMIAKGKAVFHIEYPSGDSSRSTAWNSNTVNKYCTDPTLGSASTVLKAMSLNGFVQFCDSNTATTTTNKSRRIR